MKDFSRRGSLAKKDYRLKNTEAIYMFLKIFCELFLNKFMFPLEEHNSHLITEIYYRPELPVYAFTYFYT